MWTLSISTIKTEQIILTDCFQTTHKRQRSAVTHDDCPVWYRDTVWRGEARVKHLHWEGEGKWKNFESLRPPEFVEQGPRAEKARQTAMDWVMPPAPHNSYAEALAPNMGGFRDGVLGRWFSLGNLWEKPGAHIMFNYETLNSFSQNKVQGQGVVPSNHISSEFYWRSQLVELRWERKPKGTLKRKKK